MADPAARHRPPPWSATHHRRRRRARRTPVPLAGASDSREWRTRSALKLRVALRVVLAADALVAVGAISQQLSLRDIMDRPRFDQLRGKLGGGDLEGGSAPELSL